MSRHLSYLLAPAFSLLVACGGGDGDLPGTDAAGGDATGQADAGDPSGYVELITGTWSKAPGGDSYHCSYHTVQEDIYITSFDAIAPPGTHHTVVSVADNYSGPDKEEACGGNTIAEQLLFASGVGTATYDLPSGVALKVSAGQTILLQLHLFNASGETLEGTSGTRVKLVSESEVEHLAEFFFAGTLNINLPGDGLDHTAKGSCTMETDGTIFTLWPHMHQVGKRMLVEHTGAGPHDESIKTSVLLDEPYSFEEQKMYPMTSLSVAAGDTIDVTCTWNNPQGNATKGFGDGSDDEMCFSGVYRYPAAGTDRFCGLF